MSRCIFSRASNQDGSFSTAVHMRTAIVGPVDEVDGGTISARGIRTFCEPSTSFRVRRPFIFLCLGGPSIFLCMGGLDFLAFRRKRMIGHAGLSYGTCRAAQRVPFQQPLAFFHGNRRGTIAKNQAGFDFFTFFPHTNGLFSNLMKIFRF